MKKHLAAMIAMLVLVGCSGEADDQKLSIVFTNDMIGEIRSCGCSSKDFGGLGRRATYVSGTRKTARDMLLLDGGDFFGLDLNYGTEKAALTLQAMSYMGYDGIVPGEKDFVFGGDFLVERVTTLRLPMVAANVFDAAADTLLFAPSRIVDLPNGLRVGIVGVVGSGLKLPPGNENVRVKDPVKAVAAEVDRIESETDLIVVLSHISTRGVRAITRSSVDIDFMVVGHDGRPTRKLTLTEGVYILQTASRGRFIGQARARIDNGEVVDAWVEHTALSVDYSDHAAIIKLFDAYDIDIANQERARQRASVPTGEHARNRFVGAEACRDCHTPIYDQWQETQHAHAFATLEAQSREFDRDCTPCHTTGFYDIGGFLSVGETPDLVNVQCESCHGNSSGHTKNPAVATSGRASRACIRCHTKDQTPDFAFDEFWARVRHPVN